MQNQISDVLVLLKILDQVPIPVGFYEGPDHRFVFVNKAATDTLRMKKEDVIGRPYAEVLPHATERIKIVKKVFQTGDSFVQNAVPVQITGPDGKPITEYLNYISQAYRDENGKILGVASFAVVVTSEVVAKQKLSEEAHRTLQILQNLSAGFFSVDKDWNFTYANPASQTALGLPPEEVIGKHVWTLHPHLVNSEFYHAYHRSMNERVTVEVTSYYPEQDRWYHTTSYPLDEGIAVSFSDITKRKKAEEARSLIEERFHTLTEAMPQMVWITDPDGMVNYFNRRWVERTGTKLEENLGAGWLNVIHPEDRDQTAEAWKNALTSKLYDVEYRVRMADGSYRWHVARGVPTIGEDGKIKQWVGTTTDIHQQKETQYELQRAVQSRDDFLSMASHELKTPLTVIKLQSELAKRNLRQPSAAIERNIERITRLVDDMLDISRISTGKLNLETEKVNVRELMDESIERLKPLLADAGCALTYLPGSEVVITADRFRLEQVIINLLTNAMRYGKGKPVVVTTTSTAEKITIMVKDNGAGIDPDDHKRIFERFERATSTAGNSGLGLGLFIVKIIVELHKGSIHVKSELGKGAEFIVELPRN